VLVHTVVTSGRKLRMNSSWEILGVLVRVVRSGGRMEDRSAAAVWYDGRREAAAPADDANRAEEP